MYSVFEAFVRDGFETSIPIDHMLGTINLNRVPPPPLTAALSVVVEAGAELMSSDLKSVDDAGSRDGVRQERVSGSLENLVKARALVHFLQTGEPRKTCTWYCSTCCCLCSRTALMGVGIVPAIVAHGHRQIYGALAGQRLALLSRAPCD